MSGVLDTIVSTCAFLTLLWVAYVAYRHDQREKQRQQWYREERRQLRAHQIGGR